MSEYFKLLNSCRLCPRDCGARRLEGEAGFCGVSGEGALIARAAPHYWEEPCISGEAGSGTVFFSGCNLRCACCQNREISRAAAGRAVSVQRLSEIFLELQAGGVHNLNLVTPTHYTPQILAALELAGPELRLPVVWNTGGYEKPETVALLRGRVNVFLTDLKYLDPELALKYSAAGDYPRYAAEALREMVAAAGRPRFENGLMTGGVIVRHLALPGCSADSKRVLRFLHGEFGDDIYISLMSQYTPMGSPFPELERRLTAKEYARLVDYAGRLGITQGFTQDMETASESFIPPFDLTGVQ